MLLFFDTETSGKYDYYAKPDDPRQPHLVSLASLLTDGECNIIAHFSAIVKPCGYEIPEEATAIHGISTEMATRFGLPLEQVVTWWLRLMGMADRIIAHNLDFDRRIMQTAAKRIGEESVKFILEKPGFCTMLHMVDVCKLPGGRWGDYKWPSLEEAYAYVTGGKKNNGAHNAMADVVSCRAIYRWLNQPDPQKTLL